MSDFHLQETAATILSELRSRRLLDLNIDWADELVFPAYDGHALPNVPHTVASALGHPMPDGQALNPLYFDGQDQDVDRVIVFLSDGLGYLYLQKLIQEDAELAQIVADLTNGNGILPTTSVAPSTTAVALNSLWTGVPAAGHGLTGTSLFLREIGMSMISLFFRPVYGPHSLDSLIGWGFDPEILVSRPTIAHHLNQFGIDTHVLLEKSLLGSGLSRILHRDVKHKHGHTYFSDFWLRFESLLEATRGQSAYINVYWGGVDTLGHEYGSHTPYVVQEIKEQLRHLRDLLAKPNVGDGRTLFIMTADHGHLDALKEFDLSTDPAAAFINDRLRMAPTGDVRLPYLTLIDQGARAVHDYIQSELSDFLTSISSVDALNAGLFGELQAPEAPYRIGDLVLIPRRNWQVVDSRYRRLNLIGWHAGLDEWEMLTPLIWKRL
ncbi:alkaline phosphatase family protein [Anaerolineales bacterium]